MAIELLRSVVEEGVRHGLREIIPSTMGEPLLYSDFEDILALCGELGVRLNLTTNGTFPRLGAEAWSELLVPVASDIKISINGASAPVQEEIMDGSSFARMIEGTRTLLRIRDRHESVSGHRCQVTFQLTFMESNLAEIPKLVRLALDLGVDRVKGHHLWAHFPDLEEQSLRRNPEAISRWNRVVTEARRIVEVDGERGRRRLRLENFHELGADRESGKAPGGALGGACPFLGREAWINTEGRFDPCCAPDAQRKSLGSFGKLTDQSLMEIWNGTAYRGLVKSYRAMPLCQTCTMRRPVEDPS